MPFKCSAKVTYTKSLDDPPTKKKQLKINVVKEKKGKLCEMWLERRKTANPLGNLKERIKTVSREYLINFIIHSLLKLRIIN